MPVASDLSKASKTRAVVFAGEDTASAFESVFYDRGKRVERVA